VKSKKTKKEPTAIIILPGRKKVFMGLIKGYQILGLPMGSVTQMYKVKGDRLFITDTLSPG
jgi:hypothetical protein